MKKCLNCGGQLSEEELNRPDCLFCRNCIFSLAITEDGWVDILPDQCSECDNESVGYSDGVPYCALHYRSRP